MRKKLFKEIYKLLDTIVPKGLKSLQDCTFEHKCDDKNDSVFIRLIGDDFINIGNGSVDKNGYPKKPTLFIVYDNEKKIARAARFQPVKNGEPFQMEYDIDADECCQEERDVNDYLKSYLTKLPKIADKKNKFFTKVDIKCK